MSLRELQKYTAVSKYARYVAEKGRRETWEDTAGRYEEMLVRKYPHRESRIRAACAGIVPMTVMPSMRGLQYGGPPIEKHMARGYNCCSGPLDRLRAFGEGLYLLLCGCGVGFSVQKRHVGCLPRLSAAHRAGRRLPKKIFSIPDTIEGWADSTLVLLSSWHETPVKGFEEYHGCEVEFDPSPIRPKGSPLSFGIGTAPGPAPLMHSLGKCQGVLEHALSAGLDRLDPIHSYDIFAHLADAGVSGGSRRSATIFQFDIDDEAMMNAKTGSWRRDNPQRARSNNSAAVLRRGEGKATRRQFAELFSRTKEFGEPGFLLVDDPDITWNPCSEVGMRAFLSVLQSELAMFLKEYDGPVGKDADGNAVLSGIQMCNLTSVPCKELEGEDDFLERCENAALLGTWQAGFTDFPYLGRVSELITRKEALLGVSLSGLMHQPGLLLRPEVLRRGATRVLEVNEAEAREIGINPCARGTCVKPDGNLASTLGSFPGVSGGKIRRGFRIAQANREEPPYRHFRSVNPEACEESVWSNTGSDDCIRFRVEYEGRLEEDMSALEFLRAVRLVQEHWVVPGKRPERCTHPSLCHNVSNTVMVRPHEWDGVEADLWENRHMHAGVSFIGESGSLDYAQAPFTPVRLAPEQEALYGRPAVEAAFGLLIGGPPPGFRDLWDACDCLLGLWPAEKRTGPEARAWLMAAREYASEFLGGDERKASYAIKDCFNLAAYDRLGKCYREVDYSLMREDGSAVQLSGESACAGGACII